MDFYLLISIALLVVSVVILICVIFLMFKRKDNKSQDENFQKLKYDLQLQQGSLRQELNATTQQSIKIFGEMISKNQEISSASQLEYLKNMNETLKRFALENEQKLEHIRKSVETKLTYLQEDNTKKLDKIRETVDEKLQKTLDDKMTKSFSLVSDWLEKVHKDLGEMQNLASGVGDLKNVLMNVKTKGNLGEIQLAAILEQILSPAQYESQKSVKENSSERVDFVIKLPDKNNKEKNLLLPIDAKFLTEDYQRLLDAANDAELKKANTAFESAVKKCAKEIHEKYINPPVTTDFAIMFVPTESLYAEIVRRPELFEQLQQMFKITVVGPTNLAAFLSSLQMGFRTLAIEAHSNEVWELLGAVKTEFKKFGDAIDTVKRNMNTAFNAIDQAGVRTRVIERKLKKVEELPSGKTAEILNNIEE